MKKLLIGLLLIWSGFAQADSLNIPVPSFPLSVANGGVDQTAWSSYVPTLVCQTSGTLTSATASGRWKAIGKTIEVQVVIVVTTLGTCLGNIAASLPGGITANSTGSIYPLSGINSTTNIAQVSYASSSNMIIVFASAAAANNYFVNGSFESN